MRINKFLFPLILLVIFLGVIALGMAAGYWQTKGGGYGQEHESLTPAAILTDGRAQRWAGTEARPYQREPSLWQL